MDIFYKTQFPEVWIPTPHHSLRTVLRVSCSVGILIFRAPVVQENKEELLSLKAETG